MAQSTSKNIGSNASSRKQWVKPTVVVHAMADAQAGSTNPSSDASFSLS